MDLEFWGGGVGGIEAESVMLGQPIYMLIPEVTGFRLHGQLNEGTTATDLVLQVVEDAPLRKVSWKNLLRIFRSWLR